MVGFVADIEMSLTIDELTKLSKLAEIRKCSVEQTARDCMMAKCSEALHEELFERVDKKCNIIRSKETENTERKQLLALGAEAPSKKASKD